MSNLNDPRSAVIADALQSGGGCRQMPAAFSLRVLRGMGTTQGLETPNRPAPFYPPPFNRPTVMPTSLERRQLWNSQPILLWQR
jgi:hypothetical protein